VAGGDPQPSQLHPGHLPGGDAGATYRALKAKGILVRFFDKPGLQDKLRITVGTARRTTSSWRALSPMSKPSSSRPPTIRSLTRSRRMLLTPGRGSA